MSLPAPQHGTSNRYSYGCRCAPCTQAASRADAERTLDRLAGKPRLIPAGQVRDHVNALLARGLTRTQIGQLAGGIDAKTIKRLSEGQPSVLAKKAQMILAIPKDARASAGDVPSTGAVRRVRALYALGHLNWAIAQESGVARCTVSALAAGDFSKLGVAADQGIRDAYDLLSMKSGTSPKTRLRAQELGWAPPLAWDDDMIDDPHAVPQTDAAEPVATEGENVAARWLLGESVILGAEDRKEVVQHLFEWTELTREQIADRLEMTPAATEQIWNRLKRQARLDGRPVLRRRVYALRDKELSKQNMGEAA